MAGYGTPSGFQAWLDARGYVLPDGSPDPAILLQRASDYVDAVYGERFTGSPVDVTQERAWPRQNAVVYGQILLSSVVPTAIEQATYRAAYAEAQSPGLLSPVTAASKSGIKREKAEGFEREYFESRSAVLAPLFSEVEGLLARFLVPLKYTPLAIRSIGPTCE